MMAIFGLSEFFTAPVQRLSIGWLSDRCGKLTRCIDNVPDVNA